MDNKILLKTSTRKVGLACFVFAAQFLFICLLSSGDVFAQDWAINRSWNSTSSASATPVKNAPYAPSSISIQLNSLLQQRAIIQQEITVAQRCIKNNTLSQVLRDPEGNRRVVPTTDVVNCLRTLNALNRRLVANQQAINNLNQDAVFQATQLARKRDRAALTRRLRTASGEE